MRQDIIDIITRQSDLSFEQILLNICVSALLGFVIFVSYLISHRGTIYSKKFNATLVVLTTLTGTVMTVIGNNVALSLGMVGALSIVRFRTAVKDSRDTAYIFWAIIVGICCGVGDFTVAIVGSAVVFLVLLLLGCIKNDNRMLIIVRGARSRQPMIQGTVFKLFDRKASMRVLNSSEDGVEIIYEVSEKLLKKAQRTHGDISEAIYKVGEIQYVNIVMQNDEVAN